MANEKTPSQAALNDNALRDPKQYRAEVELYLQQRRRQDLLDRIGKTDDFNSVMKVVQPRVKRRLNAADLSGPEATILETQAQFSTKPSLASPDDARQYEEDLQSIDISDLLAILFSKKDEKPLSSAEAAEKEADLPSGVARFLRQERYAEKTYGTSEEGDIANRVATVRKSEFGERLFSDPKKTKKGRYAFMAAVILGTSGAAIPGMVAKHVAKKVTPDIKEGLGVVKGRLDKWLVKHKVITQENLTKLNEGSDKKLKSFMGSRAGKTVGVLGLLAVGVTAGIAFGDVTSIKGLADGVKDLVDFDATPDEANRAGGEVLPEGELEEIDVPDLPLAEVEEAEVEEAVVDPEYSLAHPDGGISKPGLLAAASGMQGAHIDAFRLALADMPEQMSADDLTAAIAEASPIDSHPSIGRAFTLANDLGFDTDQLRAGLDTPISEGVAETQRQVASEYIASTEPAAFVPPDLSSIATPEEASYDTEPQEASNAKVNENASTPDASADVSIDAEVVVEPGGTLSDIIWDQYTAAGVSVSAADLYASGPLSDHPGGLVGMIAEQNGLENPDRIHPGDTIQISSGGAEAPTVDAKASEQEPMVADIPSTIAKPDPLATTAPANPSMLGKLVEERIASAEVETSNMAQHAPYNLHDLVDQKIAGAAEAKTPTATGQPPESIARAENPSIPETIARPDVGASSMAQSTPLTPRSEVAEAAGYAFGGFNSYVPTVPGSTPVQEVADTISSSEAEASEAPAVEVAATQPSEAEQDRDTPDTEAPDSEVSTASYSPTQ